MTVKNFKKLLKKLPSSMEVVLFSSDDAISSACMENSEIIEAEIDGKKEKVFLIVPCRCGEEPELNLN